MKPSKVALSYCAEMVRDRAPDRYLATLLAPADAREALFGLYAFDQEIAKVRQVVTQPITGLIRFQWWRDALEAIGAGRPAPAHPVAEALQHAWGRLWPARARLDAAIDARERELEGEPPETLAQLEQHLAATSSGIVLAALAILDVNEDRALDAGRRVGLAIGLAELLREIDARHESTRMLPGDLLSRHEIAPDAVRQTTTLRTLAPALGELAACAREHLREARRHRRRITRRALPALLPGALVGDHLKRLRSLGGPAGDPLATPPLAPLKLLAYRALGIF